MAGVSSSGDDSRAHRDDWHGRGVECAVTALTVDIGRTRPRSAALTARSAPSGHTRDRLSALETVSVKPATHPAHQPRSPPNA
ncbi:hypothetical protein PJI17_17000 [Mycobacterium kansasii]